MAIPLRTDFDAQRLRAATRQTKDTAQARCYIAEFCQVVTLSIRDCCGSNCLAPFDSAWSGSGAGRNAALIRPSNNRCAMPVIAFADTNPFRVNLRNFRDEVLVRLLLRPGFYVVFGKAVVYNLDGSQQKAGAQLTSRDGSNSIDISEVRIDGGSGLDDVEGMAISVQGTLVVAVNDDIVDIRCATFNGFVQQASLTAILVDGFLRIPITPPAP
jgi:hypothetical protein